MTKIRTYLTKSKESWKYDNVIYHDLEIVFVDFVYSESQQDNIDFEIIPFSESLFKKMINIGLITNKQINLALENRPVEYLYDISKDSSLKLIKKVSYNSKRAKNIKKGLMKRY